MTEKEDIESLKMEVASLRREVAELREFIKGMYTMLNEGEEYEAAADFTGGAEFGRLNT